MFKQMLQGAICASIGFVGALTFVPCACKSAELCHMRDGECIYDTLVMHGATKGRDGVYRVDGPSHFGRGGGHGAPLAVTTFSEALGGGSIVVYGK